jgi:hypothetical protein
MKRTFAAVVLLAALGIVCKLAFKPVGNSPGSGPADFAAQSQHRDAAARELDPRTELRIRYASLSHRDRELVERVAERFRQTAVRIDQTDGLRGLRLLDRLDLEAVFLYEKHPKEFHRLREMLSDDAAADLLLHWREYFGLKRADLTDRETLVAEVVQLAPSQRRLAARYPSALPLILADPTGVAELARSLQSDEQALGDALVVLSMISLESGTSDLRAGLRTIENHRALALDAFRQQGLEGFALVSLYGPILEALGSSLDLEESLILLRVNSAYVDELLSTHRPETVASYMSHVAARGRKLVHAVGGSTDGLRLAVEFGEPGERALEAAGPDAADVVFRDFADPILRARAVSALGEHGQVALVILDKYAADPDFREILRVHGGAIIPAIARADTGPEALALLQSKEHRSLGESLAKLALLTSGENGQAVIRTIQKDGLQRAADLEASQIRFYQFLPLYDVLHLGNVLRSGYTPTSGEMTWAIIDGCFVVADVLSLAAIQPEGAAASEAVRTEVKAAVREGARAAGRELAENATRRAARWWTVRSAGGVFEVLHRLPEALPKMSLSQLAAVASPLCIKAGMRPSSWRPVTLLREGLAIPFQIPPEKGLKYLAAQMLQASVGVVGFQKMEEHLSSRRPHRL